MKAVFAQKGKIVVEDIPVPACPENGVLVETHYSVVSPGTEGRALKGSGTSATQLAQQKNAFKTLKDHVDRKGAGFAWKLVEERLNRLTPLGYSCAGRIVQVGKKVDQLSVGEWVSCAGTGFANHAGFAAVPKNLVARIPSGVSADEGSLATLGAVGIHALHQAELKAGENVAIIGLGLMGMLSLALAKALGFKAWGIELNSERRGLAKKMGLEAFSLEECEHSIRAQTHEKGVDAVIVAAAGNDDEAVRLANSLCRNRGTIAVLGVVGLDLDWSAAYHKEIKLVMARSYGPGRYDAQYELDGMDYPFEYVRFTEQRNMGLFLDLLKEKKVDGRAFITAVFEVDDAPKAYEAAMKADGLGVLLKYSGHAVTEKKMQLHKTVQPVEGKIGTALIGPGHFAREIHVPNLYNDKRFDVRAVAAGTGASAMETARLLNAPIATTDYAEALSGSGVKLAFISTPPERHAEMVLAALNAGRHVFVEKPLCVNEEELKAIEKAKDLHPECMVMVGHNRRYSACAQKLVEWLDNREGPLMAQYNVRIPPSEGTRVPLWSGGRIVEEMTHFLDFFEFIAQSPATSLHARTLGGLKPPHSIDSNIVVNVSFENGAQCTLAFTTLAGPSACKEELIVHKGGGTASVRDFLELEVQDSLHGKERWTFNGKGWKEELDALAHALQGTRSIEREWQSSIRATAAAFEIAAQIRGLH
ncbi:MAG: bi-domain-containing oxidoreductase [Candidatus Diapherotrites archaeon]|nr:bi-domain-containing oxidoreductase [Candidatus Diapherotrites archaeon]